MQLAKRLCVVIVNYKTWKLTLECILSIREQLDVDKDLIIVVDNNSGGHDVAKLRQVIEELRLSNLVNLLPSAENNGFSAGNNLGISAVDADLYILANADTIFRPGSIAELLQAAKKHPDAAIISPRLEWPNGEPQISCFRFHSPFSEIIGAAGTGIVTSLLKSFDIPLHTQDYNSWPEWTSFACVLIRNNVFSRIGLLDDGYFMYFEDVDFCRRARQQSLLVLNCPTARVVHLRGQSSGIKKLQKNKKRLPAYHYSSRSRYYRKFYGSAGLFLSNLCWLTGRVVSKSREVIMGKNRTVPEHQFVDIWKK